MKLKILIDFVSKMSTGDKIKFFWFIQNEWRKHSEEFWIFNKSIPYWNKPNIEWLNQHKLFREQLHVFVLISNLIVPPLNSK